MQLLILFFKSCIYNLNSSNNNLSTKDKPVYQRKTSNGHIYINENGDVEVLTDITDVINRFLS